MILSQADTLEHWYVDKAIRAFVCAVDACSQEILIIKIHRNLNGLLALVLLVLYEQTLLPYGRILINIQTDTGEKTLGRFSDERGKWLLTRFGTRSVLTHCCSFFVFKRWGCGSLWQLSGSCLPLDCCLKFYHYGLEAHSLLIIYQGLLRFSIWTEEKSHKVWSGTK